MAIEPPIPLASGPLFPFAAPSGPKLGSVPGLTQRGFHSIAFRDWGPQDDPVPVVCVHGLSRNAVDFDDLAQALAGRGRRAIAVDLPGRGDSDWLFDPTLYVFPTYLATLTSVIAYTGARQIDWVGTSLGGLLGMMLASFAASPLRRVVINDAGSVVPEAALEQIDGYIRPDQSFDTLEAFETWLRATYAGFGPMTDAQWRRMAETSARRQSDGSYRPSYDPAIAEAFVEREGGDIDLRPIWAQVRQPVLLLRGATSDLLTESVARGMVEGRDNARLETIPGCAHAPSLMTPEQIALVADWLGA